MKKLVLAVALAATSSAALAGGAATVSQASFSPFYVGMNGGMSILRGSINPQGSARRPSDDNMRVFKNGYNMGGFVGYRMNQNMRTDVSFEYIRHGINPANENINTDIHLNTYLLMMNAYYDMSQMSMSGIVPYVGAGIGWAHSSNSNGSIFPVSQRTTDNSLAWQLGGGVNYDLTSNLALGVGYRFLSINSALASNAYSNLINASVTYKFAM